MRLNSGYKHLGDIQRDAELNRSLRLIENNGVGFEELDVPVDVLSDENALLENLEMGGIPAKRSAMSIARAIQSIFLRVAPVVQAQYPDRAISAFQHRYSRYVGPGAEYMNDFINLHTDPTDAVLCSFGTDVARTRVFSGTIEVVLPPPLEVLPLLTVRESNYSTLMEAIELAVSTSLQAGQGEMVELGEGSVDLLDVESVHARSRLFKRGHRHLSFVFFKD